ncbi:chaplin family protein [Streptomyces sp. NPDC017529]|uniref:chaplin n=1 Tax=Streptomyces sp. NPDC017529 TaxID=3365000 RepID=UPI003791AC65
MQHTVKKSVLIAATATGILAGVAASAHADSGGAGRTANSPGVATGSLVQAPVDVPVNLCGDTVDVVGVLNPAFGNQCVNSGGHHQTPAPQPSEPQQHPDPQQPSEPGHQPPAPGQPAGHKPPGHEPPSHARQSAPAERAADSPRSHHQPPTRAQAPEHRIPPEVAGAVDTRARPAAHDPRRPSAASPAGGKGREVTQAPRTPTLADTGSSHLDVAAGASAALLLAGAVLMRRSRTSRS